MQNDVTLEQVKLLVKLLKVPTFVQYPTLIRRMENDADFGSILLALMEHEYEQRQEKQNRHRLE